MAEAGESSSLSCSRATSCSACSSSSSKAGLCWAPRQEQFPPAAETMGQNDLMGTAEDFADQVGGCALLPSDALSPEGRPPCAQGIWVFSFFCKSYRDLVCGSGSNTHFLGAIGRSSPTPFPQQEIAMGDSLNTAMRSCHFQENGRQRVPGKRPRLENPRRWESVSGMSGKGGRATYPPCPEWGVT